MEVGGGGDKSKVVAGSKAEVGTERSSEEDEEEEKRETEEKERPSNSASKSASRILRSGKTS